ncbi:MAG: aspartyl/glutamyl-tRNA amidotransferase subunit C, partial [Deltaproteobacteria bacterium]|nr:aspartyl/glutamyl-tRNA amidotransferase subunit C [Deltaproteobacteria bacterium]
MKVDEQLVRGVATLARLDPDGLDMAELTRHMREVIEYVEQLKELDVTGIAATAHGRPMPLP